MTPEEKLKLAAKLKAASSSGSRRNPASNIRDEAALLIPTPRGRMYNEAVRGMIDPFERGNIKEKIKYDMAPENISPTYMERGNPSIRNEIENEYSKYRNLKNYIESEDFNKMSPEDKKLYFDTLGDKEMFLLQAGKFWKA